MDEEFVYDAFFAPYGGRQAGYAAATYASSLFSLPPVFIFNFAVKKWFDERGAGSGLYHDPGIGAVLWSAAEGKNKMFRITEEFNPESGREILSHSGTLIGSLLIRRARKKAVGMVSLFFSV